MNQKYYAIVIGGGPERTGQRRISGARQISGVDETVVPAADDDNIVFLFHLLACSCLLKIR